MSLFTLLTGAMSAGFVGCKDYDDDIETLNKETGNLKTQLTTLQGALDAANVEIANAKAAADAAAKAAADAQKAADAAAEAAAKANQLAALAQQAAAQAKAEAIEEVMAQVNELLSKKADKEEVAALAGKLEGIDSALNQIDEKFDELEKYKSAIALQIAALEEFQTLVTEKLADFDGKFIDLDGKITDINTKLDALKNVSADLAALQEKVNGIVSSQFTDEEANQLKTLLQTVSGDISKEVAQALNTIYSIFGNRLTSLGFIPTSYVNGIPCINLINAGFNPLKAQKVKVNGVEIVVYGYDSEAKWTKISPSTNVNMASYRVNPSSVSYADVKDWSNWTFVDAKATNNISRAAAAPILKVTDGNIKDGVLTVSVQKTDADKTIDLKSVYSDAGYPVYDKEDDQYIGYTYKRELTSETFNITSLRVPIADKHLTAGEQEADAAVFSDYVRLQEDYFTPYLAVEYPTYYSNLRAYDYYYGNSVESGLQNTIQLKYSESFDLNDTIATLMNGAPIDLEAYGLTVSYEIPAAPYYGTDGETDQQKFINLNGSVINAALPGIANPSESQARAAIGKRPLVAVTLKDSKGNVVNSGYIRIIWLDRLNVEVQDVTIDLGTVAIPTDNQTITKSISWTQFTNNIYAQLGVSKDEFNQNYRVNYFAVPIASKYAQTQTGWFNNGSSWTWSAASTNDLSWNLTARQIGVILPAREKVVTNTVVVTDNLTSEIVAYVTMKLNVVLPKYSIAGLNTAHWNADKSIYEISIIDPKTNTQVDNDYIKTQAYKNNILAQYGAYNITNSSQFMSFVNPADNKAFNPGYTWSYKFSKNNQPSVAVGNDTKPYVSDIIVKTDNTLDNAWFGYNSNYAWTRTSYTTFANGYNLTLKDNSNVASTMNNAEVNLSWMANNTNRAWDLVSNTISVAADVVLTWNSYNQEIVKSHGIQFRVPLTISGKNSASIVAGTTKTFNYSDFITIADAYGNTSNPYAAASATNFANVYGVEVQGIDAALTGNVTINGSAVAATNLYKITQDKATGKVTFTAVNASTTADYELPIRVTVTYTWGTVSDIVKVKVTKNPTIK